MTNQNTSKSFKQLVTDFNTDKPDFTDLIPYLTGELKADLEDFRGSDIGKWNAIKTLWQLSQPEKPQSRSRVWKSTNGYIYLVSWSNSSLLRVLGVKWFYHFKSKVLQSPLTSSKGPYRNLKDFKGRMGFKLLDRLEGQFLDELRSVVANQEEGFARATTSQYLDFLGYAQASLKEGKGEVHRLRQDNLLPSIQGSNLTNIGIDLKDWHEALKESVISRPLNSSKLLQNPLKDSRGNYRILEEFKFNYPPVDDLDPSRLTYEIFIELINKTDWHLRKLVESLEKKQNQENKFYQVEKARIKDKAKGG